MSRDRDQILEQALKHELRTADAEVTPLCLDAETLAAWEDGGIDAAAMEAAEIHLSTCARCQALAGAMSKAVPVTATVKSDEGFRLWKWWLAPIAAATAAVTIWMVVPAEKERAVAPPSAQERDAAFAQAQPKTEPMPEPVRSAPAEAPAEPPVAAEKRREQSADNRLADSRQLRADAPAVALEESRRQAESVEAKKENEAKLMREAPAAVAETAAGGARPAEAALPAPAPPPPLPAAAPATAPAPRAAAAPPPPARPLPPPARDAAEPAVGALQKQAAQFAFVPVEIASLDPATRWRTVPTGVERTEDGGRTWMPIRPRGAETITAGMSPARNVVWLVGRAGLVLVTADGSTFARVDLPERADIASVIATDARSATVSMVDGRSFRTDDSGRTWRRN